MRISQSFSNRLTELKKEIDAALADHIRELKKSTAQEFTPYSALAIDAYTQVLERGGKRIRGALTVIGYEMSGGTDAAMIVQAACAIEMIHAYILVLDDIMDKSKTRRGGPAAHALLSEYHQKHSLSGDSYHFGEAIASNSALIGCHYAQRLVAQLAVSDAQKITALRFLNEALIVTGHGQINDIFNEVIDTVDESSVDKVLEWKTAYYTFLNPLQFGMALAGAPDVDCAAIKPYCLEAGRAFQVTDDILGTFATEQEAGKSPMDDIREGKRTLIIVFALQLAPSGDKNFLIQMLGNEHLTQVEFMRCKEIIEASGALDRAHTVAANHVRRAISALDAAKDTLDPAGVIFLRALAESLLGRSA